ncbi:MAG: hypothetical protein ACC635_01730 [Acidiferrobacterales bacterium]
MTGPSIGSSLRQELAPDIFTEITNPGIPGSGKEYYFDITHAQIRTGSPEMISRRFQKILGNRARLGLAINIPLAQYTASLSVPGKPYVITPWRINAEMGRVQLSKLEFIQGHFRQRLKLHGLVKVHQFLELNRQEITKMFGQQGLVLLDIFRGQDRFANSIIGNYYSIQIIQQQVLPPNSGGKRLILRYLKQVSSRLANVARWQNKISNKIQLNVYLRKQKKIKIIIEVDNPWDSKLLFKELVRQAPEKLFANTILAIELNFLEPVNISGQEELLFEIAS